MTTEEALATFAGKFGASKYRPTFGRSLVSEVKKLNSRAIMITIVIGLVFQLGTSYLVTSPDWIEGSGYEVVTFGAQFIALYMIIFGTLAVTTEYSHNTMRTTALADPNRTRAFASKLTAVALLSGIFLIAMLIVAWFIATIQIDSFDPFNEGIKPYAAMIAFLILVALMSASFGYILRSTAGTIALMTVLMFLADLFVLLPVEFFQKTYSQLTPYALLTKAISGSNPAFTESVLFESQWIALAIFAGYTLVVVISGWVLYRKRDV